MAGLGASVVGDAPVAGHVVLRLWEKAARLDPHERALLLAVDGPRAFASTSTRPGAPDDDDIAMDVLAQAPLGRQHSRLLRLRAAAFGSDLEATAGCPRCAEAAEFHLDAIELATVGDEGPVAPLKSDGYWVEWRLPAPADLAAAADAAARGDDPERELLRRCVLSAAGPDGSVVSADRLPPPVRAELARSMSNADPLAEVLVDVTCPACGANFQSDLDVAAFVWTEVEARARRVLLDVDILARAYGWTEGDVLALSEARRAAYLRLVTEGLP
jgi:hypothetical protein